MNASETASKASGLFPPDLPVISQVLKALASLRLTVVLFALSIFLVFVGTLAQVDHDVWHVVNHIYFRVWRADVELQTFEHLRATLFSAQAQTIKGSFPFPGGKTIGLFLALNLLSAHAIRFKIAAKGARRIQGTVLMVVGACVTAAVIASGMGNEVESQISASFSAILWNGMLFSVGALALAGWGYLFHSFGKIRRPEWFVIAMLVGAVTGSAVYLLVTPDFRLNPSGLRILWQLIKGAFAALILLAGCQLLFKKRAGVVLLHGGIGLLMLGELLTDPVNNETNMLIREGQAATYTYNTRKSELTIIDRSEPAEDVVTVIPQHLLVSAATSGEALKVDGGPFDIRVRRFYPNSEIAPNSSEINSPATKGVGLQAGAKQLPKVAGTGDNVGVDRPSAYVELLDRKSGDSLGTYFVSVYGDVWFTAQPAYHHAPWFRQQHESLASQQVQRAGKPYQLGLRFKREYRDFQVQLDDFKHEVYVGTTTAKNFASDVTLIDQEQGVKRSFEIKMNNPLRYAGTTFYQASFDSVTNDATILQVVKSRSWMIPYVSCMIVGTGMLVHFWLTLSRFMQRRVADAAKGKAAVWEWDWGSPTAYVPILVAVLFGGYVLSKARPAVDGPNDLPVHRFGALALADQGRIKPYDTYARTLLQDFSERRVIKQKGVPAEQRPACAKNLRTVPAIKWMLDSIAGVDGANDYRVFKIQDLDLLAALELERREGMLYSYNEIVDDGNGAFAEQLALARKVKEEKKTPTQYQRKLAELNNKLNRYQAMTLAFDFPPLSAKSENELFQQLRRAQFMASQLIEIQAPLAAVPDSVDSPWKTLFDAELDVLFAPARKETINPATKALRRAVDAYRKNDRKALNNALNEIEIQSRRLQKQLDSPRNADKIEGMAEAEKLDLGRVRFEKFFSQFSPFYYSSVLYLIAFFFCVFSWLVYPRTLGRCATAVLIVALLLHTFALAGRISISGRPPVTNLYSSAVFIGWAAVLFGLMFEAIHRMGIGTLLGSVIGFLTLLVAYNLSLDNDTFTVMQAVLDTQFWLSTHVVTIALGYAATYAAGALGIFYLLLVRFTGALDEQEGKTLTQMLYGTLCFAIVFSFIGTVLGGLWGDDSWGRFWGWDPKENGALIIVLWIALILHARWGKMVGGHGLATLAVAGNIVTSWSWFGVNELGVGKHAYGGLSDGMSFQLTALHWVLWTHLAIIVAALLPKETWNFGASAPEEQA